jgi:hypothetical protein
MVTARRTPVAAACAAGAVWLLMKERQLSKLAFIINHLMVLPQNTPATA